ncbi:Sft1 protein [Saccharomycopsis crataegensis]|uniref:Sft1 protein n=1 Tax=Saccharomycopsis crataegensis TaxID=43959 RepID=A0AAV5QP26_9ASCO|nr:Sft1 protein [Saccharomycopsis crataegensis]
MSRYSQRESENDDQFNLLANKLSTLRSITEDINNHASHTDVMDSLSNNFDSMLKSVKNSGMRLTRSMNMGTGVWRTVGIVLVLFFIIWTLLKLL